VRYATEYVTKLLHRAVTFPDLNSACSKVLGPAKIFQFEDIGNENRFMWALFAVTANGLISKNETLVSLISNMNWSARLELLTKLIKRSN
jgi:hypothetical protein